MANDVTTITSGQVPAFLVNRQAPVGPKTTDVFGASFARITRVQTTQGAQFVAQQGASQLMLGNRIVFSIVGFTETHNILWRSQYTPGQSENEKPFAIWKANDNPPDGIPPHMLQDKGTFKAWKHQLRLVVVLWSTSTFTPDFSQVYAFDISSSGLYGYRGQAGQARKGGYSVPLAGGQSIEAVPLRDLFVQSQQWLQGAPDFGIYAVPVCAIFDPAAMGVGAEAATLFFPAIGKNGLVVVDEKNWNELERTRESAAVKTLLDIPYGLLQETGAATAAPPPAPVAAPARPQPAPVPPPAPVAPVAAPVPPAPPPAPVVAEVVPEFLTTPVPAVATVASEDVMPWDAPQTEVVDTAGADLVAGMSNSELDALLDGAEELVDAWSSN